MSTVKVGLSPRGFDRNVFDVEELLVDSQHHTALICLETDLLLDRQVLVLQS